MAKPVTPLIIWTLQRTGGTNLAARLFEKIGLRSPQHEPFNIGRPYGFITERWRAERDPDTLRGSIQEVVNRKELIKHCVEMVPWEVTEALARASAGAGYTHLFLYRKNPLDRLLSLQFAKLSGIWGAEMKDKGELSERIFAEPLPVRELVQHEQRSADLLSRTWELLCRLGARPLALAYEDVYQTGDAELSVRALLPVVTTLGLGGAERENRAFISELVSKGDQGTRDKYRKFRGIEQLDAELGQMSRFNPERELGGLHVTLLSCSWVLHATVDAAPQMFKQGVPEDIGGVVVLNADAPSGCSLELVARDGPVAAVKWGIPSPRMAKEYPEGSNRSVARFAIVGVTYCEGMEYMLQMVCADASRVPLLKLSVGSRTRD